MKSKFALILTMLITAAAFTTPAYSASGEDYEWEIMSWEEINSTFLSDRLQIGLRVVYYALFDAHEEDYDEMGNFTGGFLGSINRVSEEQDDGRITAHSATRAAMAWLSW